MPKLAAHHRTLGNAVAVNGQRTRYTIAGVRGLVLDCHPDGKRTWVARYQVGRGRNGRTGRQERIGSFIEGDPDYLTFAQAQNRCAELQVQARRDGRDPLAERRAPKPTTFGQLFADWLEGHSKVHNKRWDAYEGLYRRHVEARIGDKAVGEITRTVVADTLDDIARKVSPLQSIKCQTLISSVFSWALDEGRVSSHPSVRLRRRHREVARDRVMSDDELRRFWRALEGEAAPIARALRLLIVTGGRLSEVAEAERSELSSDGVIWTLPRERVKNARRHVLPLPDGAAAIFRDAIGDAHGSRYVFPASRGDGPLSTNHVSREFARIVQGLGIEGMRLHDLRHCAMTGMAAIGVPLEIRQLVANQWTGRRQAIGRVYDQHDYIAEKRRALELWERRLLEIVEGRPKSQERW
jgi:integrase